jgi:hypothetical protein
MHHNDKFLTFAISIGLVFNCIAKLLGGIILDRVLFKSYFTLILTLSCCLAFTF